ncbi:MAG: hypothetical protein C4539_06205 [Ignavibacteriales bacterium]|nr:MAG: hypothetical protein C4539_06205 [Ignavibacteriales bacterium]
MVLSKFLLKYFSLLIDFDSKLIMIAFQLSVLNYNATIANLSFILKSINYPRQTERKRKLKNHKQLKPSRQWILSN